MIIPSKATRRAAWFILALYLAVPTLHQTLAQRIDVTPSAILLKGGTIIAYDDKKNDIDIIRGGSLLIVNDRIVAVGNVDEDVPAGTEVVDVTGSIITPGFVDTHKHCWEHLYQTLGPDVTLNDYLYKFSNLAEITAHIDAQDVYISSRMSLADSLNGGVTSILDHGHGSFTPDHDRGMLKAQIESGARVWHGYSIAPVASRANTEFTLDDSGMNKNGWRWEQLAQLANQAPWANGRVQLGLAWDAGRNDNEGKYGFQRAAELNLTFVTMHDVGYPLQILGYASKPIYQIYEWGYLNSTYPIVFSHGTLVDGADLNLLRKYNHFVSVTPESEHHYAHGQLFTHRVLEQAAIGTDTSFTFSSDILSQMRLQLQSTRNLLANPAHFNMKYANNTAMTAKQAFLLGTRNGGLALRRPDIGVIKKGAKADVVVFNSNNTAFSAFYDPVAAVVLHAHVGDIEHVLVDGRWVKRSFQLQSMNWSKVQADFKTSAKKIQKIWLDYAKDWGRLREAMLGSLGNTEEMYEPVRMVNVNPTVL
ncbi:hypothetical protein BGX28_003694 [Mortierella sp. GBA30]|nr:hypothetical protein BGX28_003694 [Mortierella sp. GBA30]